VPGYSILGLVHRHTYTRGSVFTVLFGDFAESNHTPNPAPPCWLTPSLSGATRGPGSPYPSPHKTGQVCRRCQSTFLGQIIGTRAVSIGILSGGAVVKGRPRHNRSCRRVAFPESIRLFMIFRLFKLAVPARQPRCGTYVLWIIGHAFAAGLQ